MDSHSAPYSLLQVRESQGDDRSTEELGAELPGYCQGETGVHLTVLPLSTLDRLALIVLATFPLSWIVLPPSPFGSQYHVSLPPQVGSIGNSVQGRPLLYIKLSANVEKVVGTC